MASLLSLVKQRAAEGSKTGFNYGIGTAAPFVKSIRECVGSDLCYRYAASKDRSFEDILQKAASTLVYSNDEMLVEEVDYSKATNSSLKKLDDVELPKNTLMVFKNWITTPKQDRDKDIMRSEGAQIDKNMLLLWQHVPTLPIGKFLRLESQDKKGIKALTCIVDINDLAHDAAVMVDNGMARFSHGFRALDFEMIEDDKGRLTGGFDVKEFEIMEESIVSVPANTDATVDEVILSLVEGGKMTSMYMKEAGRKIREERAKQFNFTKEFPKGEKDGEKDGEKECGCGGKSTSTEEGTAKPKDTKDTGKQGRPETKHEEVSLQKSVFYAIDGTMEGSYERIQKELCAGVKLHGSKYDCWCVPVATFSDSFVYCEMDYSGGEYKRTCYRSSWEMIDGKATLTGELKEVEIKPEIVEKAFLAATKGSTTEEKEDPKKPKKPCPKNEETTEEKEEKNSEVLLGELTISASMEHIITAATFEEKKRLVSVLQAMVDVEQMDREAKEFLAAIK